MPSVLIEVEEKDLRVIEEIAKREKRDRKWQITKILEDYVIQHAKMSALIEREKK